MHNKLEHERTRLIATNDLIFLTAHIYTYIHIHNHETRDFNVTQLKRLSKFLPRRAGGLHVGPAGPPASTPVSTAALTFTSESLHCSCCSCSKLEEIAAAASRQNCPSVAGRKL